MSHNSGGHVESLFEAFLTWFSSDISLQNGLKTSFSVISKSGSAVWELSGTLSTTHAQKNPTSDHRWSHGNKHVFTFLYNRLGTLTFCPFEQLISVPFVTASVAGDTVLNLLFHLSLFSVLSSLPLLCLSSLTVHLFVSYRHPAVCFLSLSLWLCLAVVGCCRQW